MLKQRLWTAALLIPLVVLSILYLPSPIFQYLVAGVVALAAIEWFTILGFVTRTKLILALVVLVISTAAVSLLPVGFYMKATLIIWGLILFVVSKYAHRSLPAWIHASLMHAYIALGIASLVLALLWQSAIQLHQVHPLGPQQLLFVIVLVWLADTGGYFAGKKFGKTPLAKAISPNKTWEGVAGALVLGSIWTTMAYYMGISGEVNFIQWLLLSVSTLLISVVGDLFESLFKRCHKVKDSGNLLPGHGGILDRIDSLIAAIPVFTAGLFLMGSI